MSDGVSVGGVRCVGGQTFGVGFFVALPTHAAVTNDTLGLALVDQVTVIYNVTRLARLRFSVVARAVATSVVVVTTIT